MKYTGLIKQIQFTHEKLYKSAVKSVNIHLTFRNLLIGYYIVEYEQNGKDRAEYGTNLLKNIAGEIEIRGLTAPELSRCRQFYNVYGIILSISSEKMTEILPKSILSILSKELKIISSSILGSVTQELKSNTKPILGSLTQELQNSENVENTKHFPELFSLTSYTHFSEIIKIKKAEKRSFYELLMIKTQPSVRELKRQIESLSYERLGLSQNKETAFEQLKNKIEPSMPNDLVKSHYFFEFLNFNSPNLVEEKELESALLQNLQNFILELGNGFCFEARQKRILLGDEYFFIDIVFYHRILKCHVLIELKTRKAKHEHIGQLRTYVQYYKKYMMQESDNPPVGILLVTDKNETLVEFAIAENDKELFVSKYALQLPKKEELTSFINNELKRF